jgi:FkbM family methyltransferase
MRTDVVVKTWWGDLCWISYALKFLVKNWKEPESNFIVLADANCQSVIKTWGFPSSVRYFYFEPWPDGNAFQTYLTLLCDNFSDADLFAIWDSDTMLIEPMQASDHMIDGKPIIWFDRYDTAPNPSVPQLKWGPIMRYWLGVEPHADHMQRFPFLYRASTLANVRRLITSRTGQGLKDSLYSATPYSPATFGSHPFKFCEHNVIGFYAALHEPDQYAFCDVRGPTPPWRQRYRQYHSWSQWSTERIRELDNLYLIGKENPTPEDQIMQTAQGWWVLRRDTHLSRWVEQTQRLDHDQTVLQQLRPYIRPGSTVIDAGAAIGDHTIFYLNAVGEQGTVYAFEPHPIQYLCLSRNCPQARCYPVALGEAPGKVHLFHEPDVVGGSRLIDPKLQWPMSSCERVTLDSVVEPKGDVSFFKIDVEGCEPEVLRGAREIIKQSRPIIWFEQNPEALQRQGHSIDEVRDVVAELGYRVVRFYPEGSSWNGSPDQKSQCDILCAPA